MQKTQIVAEIKSRIDLKDIISHDVKLRRNGRDRWVGLCPFHAESVPSFTVFGNSSYFCFSCKVGGDSIKYVSERYSLDFKESVEWLSKKAGIEIDYKKEENKNVRDNAKLAKIFHDKLKGSEKLYNGLLEKGFTEKIIKDYQIGYIPGNDWLKNIINLNNVKVKLNYKFQNRIIFPIKNVHGETVGFGGKTLNGHKAKYINSSESEQFKKSELLYGIEKIKGKVDEIALVEGYTDVLWLVKEGINVVASMGTAMSDKQAKLLKNRCEQVVVLYDGDDTGVKASYKTAMTLMKTGVKCRIGMLPEKMDPKDYVQKYGKKINDILVNSKDFDDYVFEYNKDMDIRFFTNIAKDFKNSYQVEFIDKIGKKFCLPSTEIRQMVEVKRDKWVKTMDFGEDSFIIACFVTSDDIYSEFGNREYMYFEGEQGVRSWQLINECYRNGQMFTWNDFLNHRISEEFKQSVITESDCINLDTIREEFVLRMNRLRLKNRRVAMLKKNDSNGITNIVKQINENNMRIGEFYRNIC